MWALRASAMAAGGATPQAFSRRSVPPAVNLRSSFRTSPLVAPFTSSSAMGRRNKKIGSGKQPRRHLAEEIIEEILSRLPVKSLLRFQLVSKSWASLIGSERFIKTHLQNSRENADLANHRVIHDYLPEIALSSSRKGEISELQYSVHSLMNDPVPEPSGLEHLTDFHIVGCCNGLVCIRNPLQKSFYLWNPSTRICMELPKLETKFFINRTGLGWDESSGAYKVFVFLHVYAGMDRCVVYSSNTNEWEKVETDFDWGIFCAKEEGMLVNGRLHWHGFGKKIVAIVSLDLKSAEIGSMEHPRGGLPLRVIRRDFVGHRLSLGVIGGCLSVAHHRRKRGEKLDVWVMKEYKDCSSWYRAMAVRLDHLIRPYYQPCLYMKTAFGMPRGGTANVLGQAPGGEILISYESFFLACHPKPKKKNGKGAVVSTLKEIENCGRVRAHLYFETLVSPKRILGQNVM